VDTANVAIAEIKARGQLTIPKKIREIRILIWGHHTGFLRSGM